MAETQALCMEQETRSARESRAIIPDAASGGIERVSDQRVSRRSQVDADLVASPGHDPDLYDGLSMTALQHADMAEGRFAAPGRRVHGTQDPMAA
jgi:hypothetical protein